MIAKCMVVEDTVKDWEMDGKKGKTRSLHCIEQGNEHLLIPKFRVKIPLDDKIAGPHDQANLTGAVVDLAITDVTQDEYNKRLTFSGNVLKIVGRMRFEPAPEKANTQTVKA